ncbi:helix-turn-helix transcriptional regulator [Oculatella sp. LEGE 06141]|uniref:helix-turn-helix transcriptional regulator n=1 Tax=Oculatella sp. LEGE 06141 TaxID=1828648 RepID=UPI001881D428|nr:AraC family transcriptional regulator [Oculatella sp. LEGE 06141]MBE9180611.1 helix-turn-helix transcriptional regulator [Oculatella sp. LEGE 06141]
MPLDLIAQEVDEIWTEAEQCCPSVTSIDRLETIYTMPPLLGSGYRREIELYPGLELCVFNEIYNDLTLRALENKHLVQFKVHLSGVEDSGDYMLIDAAQSYVGGSGIQRRLTVFMPKFQPHVGVNIHLQPHLLNQFFATPTGELPPELQPLIQGDNWQKVFSTKTTAAMRSVVQQIIDCPFMGMTKRLYLQGKVFELMALQLDGLLEGDATETAASLKPDTLARIHFAAEILRSQLEHPPIQTELARQVGVSDRTLRRGFQALFGTTIMGYLTEQRLIQAAQLLQQGWSVAEVVHRCGYSNQGHFAAAFRRKFGVTPKQWAMGCQSAITASI